MDSKWLALGLALVSPAGAAAQGGTRPIVVELFTSQGCSSCPPADAIMVGLAHGRSELLPLTFHVTYWNSLGWRDPFSLEAATQRQRRYVALAISPDVYTPAMVVDGQQDVVGSNPNAVAAAVTHALARRETAASIKATRRGHALSVTIGAGTGQGNVLLIGFDPEHRTQVGRGENTGRLLLEANVVRSIALAGLWTGAPLSLSTDAPAGEQLAIIVQSEDGRILAASRVDNAA